MEITNVDKSLCPNDAIYYFKPENFWTQHKSTILITIGVLLLLVIYFLIFQISLLKKNKLLKDKEVHTLSQYRDLFNNMPIIYTQQELICDPAGQIIDFVTVNVNPEFEKIFVPRQKIVGKKGSEITPTRDFSAQLYIYNTILKNQNLCNTEYFNNSNKRYYDIFFRLTSDKKYIDIFCLDTTDIQTARQNLASINHKLAMSLDVANITPWKWDLNKKTILCDVNRATELSMELEEDELSVPDRKYFAKIHKEDLPSVLQAYQDLIEKKIPKIKKEYRVINPKNGEIDWIEARATIDKLDSNNNPQTLIGSSLVITERKKMEQDLREAKLKAEESNRLKSAFLANMSHEIRTPLNAIVGFSNILTTAENDDDKKEYIDIIENNNTLLLQLINDILDLSKIEAGTLDFNYTSVNINGLLSEMEHSMALKIHTEDIKLLFTKKQDSCFMHTEKNRLQQILTNLINNAIKFTQKGTISFGYEFPGSSIIRFFVSDTGCGIPQAQQQSIFGRFVKLNNFEQGSGLGLSICETIVNKMGGKIGVDSEEGKGSTFWFTLPFEATSGILKSKDHQETPVTEISKNEKLTILIAEDNPSNYKLFESILKREYILLHAWNGEEAVELYREYKPHLILMDINMPVLDGYGATKKIREISSTVPIIAVTAYAFTEDEDKILRSGFDGYTSKPINANTLKNKISDLLKNRILFI
ncbi:ATP-binding protein [Coprobacter sp.]